MIVGFQRVPARKTVKNRAHLDFATAERTAEVERLRTLGASHVADHEIAGFKTVVIIRGNQPTARLTALTTAFSEAVTMLASTPTPHSTRSPTAHST